MKAKKKKRPERISKKCFCCKGRATYVVFDSIKNRKVSCCQEHYNQYRHFNKTKINFKGVSSGKKRFAIEVGKQKRNWNAI